jgi:hypothetical protein
VILGWLHHSALLSALVCFLDGHGLHT